MDQNEKRIILIPTLYFYFFFLILSPAQLWPLAACGGFSKFIITMWEGVAGSGFVTKNPGDGHPSGN